MVRLSWPSPSSRMLSPQESNGINLTCFISILFLKTCYYLTAESAFRVYCTTNAAFTLLLLLLNLTLQLVLDVTVT